jgi:rod shape-determining protein MreC
VIRNHDQVVTSGSTVYPRNLVLGYVIDAGLSNTGVAKYAILEPAADIDNLEQVFVLTGYAQE